MQRFNPDFIDDWDPGGRGTGYAFPAAISGSDGYATEPTSVLSSATIHVERTRPVGSTDPMQLTHAHGDVSEYHLAQVQWPHLPSSSAIVFTSF